MICRKHVQGAVMEPETEEVTSQEQNILTEEEEKKKADSLWSGMVVETDQSFGLIFSQFNNFQNLYLTCIHICECMKENTPGSSFYIYRQQGNSLHF
jgi:hypothetical protein